MAALGCCGAVGDVGEATMMISVSSSVNLRLRGEASINPYFLATIATEVFRFLFVASQQ